MVSALKFDETPNYKKMIKLFQNELNHQGFDFNNELKFDWVIYKENALAEKLKREAEEKSEKERRKLLKG